MLKSILIILTVVSVFGCASKNKDEGKIRKFSKVEIEKYVVAKKSSKADVIKALGSPEMINSLSDKTEQWVYSKSAANFGHQSGGIGAGILGFVSSSLVGFDVSGSSTSASLETKTKTLEINFNSKGIVADYSFSYSRI